MALHNHTSRTKSMAKKKVVFVTRKKVTVTRKPKKTVIVTRKKKK